MSSFVGGLAVEILGGGIVAIFSFIFLIKFSTLFNKPSLEFVIKQNGKYSKKILYSQDTSGNYVFDFDLAIKNSGGKSLQKDSGFWHIYLLSEKLCNFRYTENSLELVDKNHMRNLISFPILSKSILDLNLNLKITYPDNPEGKISMYGWISTEFGSFPKNVKLDKVGQVKYKDMQIIFK